MESERKKDQLVDEFITRGYKVQQQSQYTTKVKEKNWGTPVVHAFVFLFAFVGSAVLLGAVDGPSGAAWVITIGANVTYAAYSWFASEEIIIKVSTDASASSVD